MLSSDSACLIIELLNREGTSWGVRASALKALALHSPSCLAPHAHAICSLLHQPEWGLSAVGMQALEYAPLEKKPDHSPSHL